MDEQTKKIYSEIIEFSAWDFCEDSLLPGPVLLQAVNMQIKTFSHYYWNMFNRIWDKKVTYEIPMMNVHILDKKVDFPIESRLLDVYKRQILRWGSCQVIWNRRNRCMRRYCLCSSRTRENAMSRFL